jgi:T5SS/PEP-CTERM-associated repeat protein
VSGRGSSWIGLGDVYLGNEGSSNVLDVLAGASVNTEKDVLIGVQDSAANNALKVAGEDSKLGSRDMFVGYIGGQNTLRIEDGGDEDFNINQTNVSDALNRHYNAGGDIPVNVVPLLGMTGDTRLTTLSDLSGEVGATGGANQMQPGATTPQAGDALASSVTSDLWHDGDTHGGCAALLRMVHMGQRLWRHVQPAG